MQKFLKSVSAEVTVKELGGTSTSVTCILL